MSRAPQGFAGITNDPALPPQTHHPDTHEVIAGARLTTHPEVIALALTGHERLDVPWSVGWDVAMTPDGAVLVEGNPMWAISLFHVPHRSAMTDAFAARVLEQVLAVW